MNHFKEIQNVFQKELEKEVLKNEILRLKILFVVFCFTSLLFLYFAFAQKELFQKIFSISINPFLPSLYFIGISIYFLILTFVLQAREKKSKPIFSFPRYFNAFFEISLPSFVFFILAEIREPYSIYVMLTPPLVVYFIFIIASGFRLDFKISVFTGVAAGLEYLALCAYYLRKEVPDLPVSFLVIFPSFLMRSLVLVVSGIIVGYLTSQMQRRLVGNFALLYEKEKVTQIFGKHVSPQVVKELLNEQNLSETKFVSILFFDLRNFTSFSETRPPKLVVEFLNQVFEVCVNIIEKNHGIVNKFLGDGFMAVFGAPISSGNDVRNALNSALEIRDALSYLETQEMQVGMGIHCGNALIGNVGSENRKEYTVIGDTVNLASRIEQLNKTYKTQILFSKDVLLHTQVSSKFIDKVKVKGREEEVEIYSL